jgi:hypothetical protein
MKWNNMIMRKVVEKAKFEFDNAVFSSLGGAYATLKNVSLICLCSLVEPKQGLKIIDTC